MATAGFVVALVGAVLALIPILGIVSWLICPVGLILSVVGLVMAGSRAGAGRGLSIAGIALGAVGLLICTLYAAVFASAFSDTASGRSTSSYQSPSSYSTRSPASSAGATSLAPGTFGQGTYVVGQDIQPGRYRTAGAPESLFRFCMASRQKLDGTTIGFPETTNEGPAFIEVKASDGQVEFTGDCTWARQ